MSTMSITPGNAYKLPAPKGFRCAAGCGHGIAVHREAGCDVDDCDCPAPYGRILPSSEAGGAVTDYTLARTCECGALIEEIDSGDGYTYWAHVKRMRIEYDHAAVPSKPQEEQ